MPAAPEGARPDNLARIKGTDPRLIALLRREGITTFAQLASLTEAQIDALGSGFGCARENPQMELEHPSARTS